MDTPLYTYQAATPEQSPTGRFRAVIDIFAHRGEDFYLASTTTSGAVFDTAADAWAGADRAIECVERTGKFPNMCEAF